MLRNHLRLLLLLAAATSCAFAAPAQWTETHTGHFTILSDTGEKNARKIGDQFERMRWMFHTLFPNADVDPAEPLIVVAVKNSNEFRNYESADYLAKGKLNLAGYFEGSTDKDYILIRTDAEMEHPLSIIIHEYTHLQFRSAGEWMPLWLNEGEAEFMQNTDFREKDVVLGEASVNDIYFLRQNQLIPLPVLFRVDHKSPYYHEENKGSIFYAESWALTHYLMVTGKMSGKNLIGDYIVRMSRHEDPVQAAQESFGDLNDLTKALQEYIRNESFKQFILRTASAPIDESTFTIRTMTPVEADVVRADVLAHMDRSDEAAALAGSLMQTDPANPVPHETLAYIALRKGNDSEAIAQYAQAAQLHSTSFYTYAEAASQTFGSSKSGDDKKTEELLRTAIRLNPHYFPSYRNLVSLQLAGGNLDEARKTFDLAKGLAVSTDDKTLLREMATRINGLSAIKAERTEEVEARPLLTRPEPTSTALVNVQTIDHPPMPTHPNEPTAGPHHTADGVIRSVQCGYPSALELTVAGPSAAVKLYTSNYFQLEISALNFTPSGEMNPCKDLEGMKAKVVYAESSDKSVDGQIVSIGLRK
jgi:tetratricopeptide (TPR) repeat protein